MKEGFRISEEWKRYLSQNAASILVILFVIVGMVLRFMRFANRELWGDEIFQLQKTVGAFKPIWQRISYGDNSCFPGDYLLTFPFIQISNGNKWILVIPHIVVTLLGFYVLYLICRQYFKTWVGYAVTFGTVAFNRELIFHAFEFRPYAALPTLALASFYLSHILTFNYSQIRRLHKVLIFCFFLFCFWFHAHGILIVSVCVLFYFLYLFRDQTLQKAKVAYLKFFLAVFAAALPLWLWYVSANPLYGGKWHTDIFYYFPNPVENTFGFLKGIVGNLLGNKAFYFLLGGGVAFFLPAVPKKTKYLQVLFLLSMVILPIELVLMADIFKSYIFVQRQFVWVMPLFAMFLGWMWDTLIVRLWRTVEAIGAQQNGFKVS